MAKKTDAKMDLILEQLKQLDQLAPMSLKIDNLHTSLGSFKEELGCLTFTVQGHEDRLVALERDLKSQKEFANSQQQQLRSLTVRLLNVSYTPGESVNNYAMLKESVYNRFLLPLLTKALDNNDISTIPPATNILDSCFRPYVSTPGKQPPPVIIKLSSRQLKIAVMKNKRELPKPTAAETEAGITRFILVEDLTPDNHRTLAALSKSKLTDKVWSVDGRIKFTKANRPDVVMTMKSVYDPITKILSD